MKKKPLAYYLDLIKLANDQEDYNKAQHYGEIVVKELNKYSYSPLEEYILYYRLGYAFNGMAEYSRSLDSYYKAGLVASRNHLNPAYGTAISYMLGYNFQFIKNSKQALIQFQKVEDYYQKYGDTTFPMDKRTHFNALVCLSYCYFSTNNLEKVREIIEQKLQGFLSLFAHELTVRVYYQLKGEYLMAIDEYKQARQFFNETVKLCERFNFALGLFDVRIRLAVIDLLEGQIESAIESLNLLLKEIPSSKYRDVVCEASLLLSKCYLLTNMPAKAVAVEKRIKFLLNKIDIVWLYEKNRSFEQLYSKLQPIYQTTIESGPNILINTINKRQEKLSCQIIGQSPPMQEVFQLLGKIAPTDLPVLIQGDTGTGKELIARFIRSHSLRNEKPWLALNCGAIPESILENELFGHAKGAFTDAQGDKKGYIETASGGTFLLDEIGDMSPAMQQKLLRVLEEKLVWPVGAQKPVPADTRFIFASNQNIEVLVKAKKFREDLYYRINTIVITLPPLRNRKEDIPLLISHFFTKYPLRRPSSIIPTISPDALRLFVDYPWPGNVRELENEMKRVSALYPNDKIITEFMISDPIRKYNYAKSRDELTLKEAREIFERNFIIDNMNKYNTNITKIAQKLGCTRRGLYKKIKQLGINLGKNVTQK